MTNNTSNPWIGLDSYREGQILYGRSREIRDLSMAVFYNRQTVVYGRSGIGKSSLLHAGIFPEARLRGCLPVSVRFDHSGTTGYSDQFFRVISDAVKAVGGTMHDMVSDNEPPRSMWEFFHRFRPEKEGKELTPLIVVDQFEEIFTLSKNPAQVSAFFDELADLLNDVMPDYLQSSVQQVVKPTSGSMFDGLDFQMPDNRYMSDTNFHLVLVLREDYLSYLERFSRRIPALKQNRYGLLPITYAQAQEIITQPCPGLVSAEVADAIIRQVVTEEQINDETSVDSAILSLFLSRLYEKKGDAANISLQLVEDQGDALLEDFYAEIVASLDKKTVMFLEDTLINADGHRENITLESLYKNSWLQRATIEKLEQSHLLRLFSYGDVQRVEFAHDVLCPIIVRRRSQRENEARYRKSKRRAVWAYVIIFIGFFLALATIEIVDQKLEEIRVRDNRLTEMEASLIEKGAQKMLDNYDIYGAIQLLINSMDDDLDLPSKNIACKELYLRQSLDSLLETKSEYVSSIHRKLSLGGECVVSRSKRICGVVDQLTNDVIILDTQTGAIVQVFSGNNREDHHDLNKGKFYLLIEPDEDNYMPRAFPFLRYTDSTNLFITDIYPLDTRCLLIADDTTLLDCHIYTGEYKDVRASTLLCIHDVHSNIIAAAYSESGDSIAIQLSDSSLLLYDAQTGEHLVSDSEIARNILLATENRRFNTYREVDGDGGREPDTIQISDYTKLSHYLEGEYVITLSSDKETTIKNKLVPHASHVVYRFNEEQEKEMREHLDSLNLSDELLRFQRTYSWKFDSLGEVQESLYIYPLAINKSHNRVATVLFSQEWNDSGDLYAFYPHNGAAFYHSKVPYEVHTLHFTEDDQFLIINAGEDTEEAIYLPPLPQLMEQCKSMFFDWKMSEEERYQTYIHMND